ncbi:MAG: type II toxin-antitoxin system RelE/ParE family toxin [Terracidiphilus sp.]
MPVQVVVTNEFVEWWNSLTAPEQVSVDAVVRLLEAVGVLLGFPHTSAIAGSKKLRELRIQHCGEPYRILYAFDPARNAVLLLGGKKTGQDRWYERSVPHAESTFEDYLRETGQG